MTLAGFLEHITCVALSPSGQVLAAGNASGIVRMYETPTGVELRSFHAHTGAVNDLCFIGAALLATASSDETLSLWNATSGRLVTTIKEHGFVSK